MRAPVYRLAMRFLVALTLSVPLLAGCATYMSDPLGPKSEFRADLRGANEVPPNPSAGHGEMTAIYWPKTRVLEWHLFFGGLSGPVTWAYFHGPDGVGNDDAAIAPINGISDGNPRRGGATLTDRQAADLLAGRWSVNIRTEQFPGGEIRGPVVPTTSR
jgi:hypothetical protein